MKDSWKQNYPESQIGIPLQQTLWCLSTNLSQSTRHANKMLSIRLLRKTQYVLLHNFHYENFCYETSDESENILKFVRFKSST